MRINFYSESPDPGPGGAEQFVAVLAEALSASHGVCIVHHKPPSAEKMWAEYSGCDLSRVKFRFVPMTIDESHLLRAPWARYRAAKGWRRELTEDCDLFVGLLHNKPPFCHARKGAIVVLFPTYQPLREPEIPPASSLVRPKKNKKKQSKRADLFSQPWFRRAYLRFEWNRRLASYSTRLSISDFSRRWTRKRWRIESDLLFPPVAIPRMEHTARSNRILSVGRFATTGHTKKQIELLQAFRELSAEVPGWTYANVGGVNESAQDLAFFEQVHALGEEMHADVRANLERAQLLELYRSSRIFWHAAGLGEDHETQPEQAEHFGLTTVEAMANGCVPLVINQGGQPEIVEHGVSGFVWNTLEELKDYTRRLTSDAKLLQTMAIAARQRAEIFSREKCVERFCRFVGIERV